MLLFLLNVFKKYKKNLSFKNLKYINNFLNLKNLFSTSILKKNFQINKFSLSEIFLKKKHPKLALKNSFYNYTIFFFFFSQISTYLKIIFFKILYIFYKQNNLNTSLKTIFNSNNIVFLPKKQTLDSYLVLSYILKKIKVKRLRIRFLLKTLVDMLSKKVLEGALKGFKFQISGRITKKDRAVYIWERHFKTSLNTKSAKVDYTSSIFITKFSSCMFKL